MAGKKIAFVAALPRELEMLTRDWSALENHGSIHIFECEAAIAACAGMGVGCARRAARAILDKSEISCVVSIGWAGGLNRRMKIAEVVTPRTIIDAESGARFEPGIGRGVLVTTSAVARLEMKQELAQKFGADLVDMEAAGIFALAEECHLPCYAVKAISDEQHRRLPDIDEFNRHGQLVISRFIAHVVPRPWLWPLIARLGWNSRRALDALKAELEKWIAAGGPPQPQETALPTI